MIIHHVMMILLGKSDNDIIRKKLNELSKQSYRIYFASLFFLFLTKNNHWSKENEKKEASKNFLEYVESRKTEKWRRGKNMKERLQIMQKKIGKREAIQNSKKAYLRIEGIHNVDDGLLLRFSKVSSCLLLKWIWSDFSDAHQKKWGTKN